MNNCITDAYAALAEAYTIHPIGKSIIKEYGKPLDKKRIHSISNNNNFISVS